MPELLRTRDCIILVKGDSYTVAADASLVTSGWRGGQGCRWVTPLRDEFVVASADGLSAGFFLWGSDEPSDQFTSMTRQQPSYRYAVIGAGGWLIVTSTYEKYTYASRVGGGPLVPITYNPSDKLFFSLRGYWTNEDEWTLSGDPRAPNDNVTGFVAQTPSAWGDFMTIQTML